MKSPTITVARAAGPFVLALLLLPGCTSTKNTTAEAQPEEKVDVGYGAVDSEKVMGAVSTVDGEVAKEIQPRSVEEMLQGRAAGVEVSTLPGGGLSVRIRGRQSFMSGGEPLYVVDNMPMSTIDGALYGINPYDIESITVLKDAASTAIYGSRGANGVILIKTKGAR